MINTQIILGSGSKARQKILESLGYKFTIIAPDLDEKSIRCDDFQKLPLELARAKSENIRPKIQVDSEYLLITSDTVVVFENLLREKPQDEDEARAFLMSYCNKSVAGHTGVVIYNSKTKTSQEALASTTAWFGNIPQDVIEQIIIDGRIMKASGAFRIEDPLLTPYIKKIEGEITTMSGLPKELVKEMVERSLEN